MNKGMEPATLLTLDWLIIATYLFLVALVGWVSFVRERRRMRSSESKNNNADGYFLAGRTMGWLPIGLSLFVSNIGSEHLLGLTGSAAADGMAIGIYELRSGGDMIVLGWLMAPIFLRAQISSVPEYLERRYSHRLRSLFSAITLLSYVFIKLSGSIFSAATVLSYVFGWPLLPAATALVVLTALYAALGGLGAVMLTDCAQSAVLLTGLLLLTVLGMQQVGGIDGLRETPPEDVTPDKWERFFHLYRPPEHETLPTYGVILGQTLLNLWYWTLDQAIVQRVLAARSVEQARGGCLLAGYLKASPFFIMVVPGIIARRLFSAELHPNGFLQSNLALPVLMKRLLPHGVLGLMLAATLAACMSSLDSVFTAAGSLFCLDIYRPYFRPGATEREFVLIGRLLCVILGVVTLLWIPVMSLFSDQIFVYLQSVSSYFAPPAVAVYYAGVLWKRANSQGAAAAFIVGYVLCLGRLVGEVVYKSNGGANNPADSPGAIAARLLFGSQFLNACFAIFCCSMLALVIGSLNSPSPTAEQLRGLTVYRSDEQKSEAGCECWRSCFGCSCCCPCRQRGADDTEGGGTRGGATSPAKGHDGDGEAHGVAATAARFELLERSGHSAVSSASSSSLGFGGGYDDRGRSPTGPHNRKRRAFRAAGARGSPSSLGSSLSSVQQSPRSTYSYLCQQLSLNPNMDSSLWQRVRDELKGSADPATTPNPFTARGGAPSPGGTSSGSFYGPSPETAARSPRMFHTPKRAAPSPLSRPQSPASRRREDPPPDWAIEMDRRLRLLGLAAVQESIDSLVTPHQTENALSDADGWANGGVIEEGSRWVHRMNVLFTIGLVALMGTLIGYWA